jgi:quercetin dioxygenase-like cupin family protein
VPDAPAVIDATERRWEGWARDQVAQRGTVQWQTLVSAGVTPSSALTAGRARITPGGALSLHRHTQAELYFVVQGSGVVTVDGERREVGPGSTVFIPGDAVHGIECSGPGELRFNYVLAADRFEDVEYIFDV